LNVDTPSIELQVMLYRVRDRIANILKQGLPHEDMDKDTRGALFAGLHSWFPELMKFNKDTREEKRRVRLGVLMALTGSPLSSANDLDKNIAKVIVEVLHDPSAYLTPELAAELQKTVYGMAYGTPYRVPTASPENLAVRTVR